jgi:glutamyl-tRNA reductase
VQAREKVSFSPQQQRVMLRKMHTNPHISEAVILDTCNRIEFYIYARKNFNCNRFLTQLIAQVSPDAVDTWGRYSRQSTDIDVVRHLFEVAAGLDSQTIGENQILSQLKSAYSQSLDCQMSKFMFHRLFHNAFRVGKAVRTDTDINCGAVSIGLAAVELAKEKIDLSTSNAMVIGAGENAELVARYLLKNNLSHLIFANRNTQKAKTMAARLFKNSKFQASSRIISLNDIPAALPEVDLLISSTAAPKLILTYKMIAQNFQRRKRPLLIIDIAVPRDIDPNIGQFDCVSLYNIDDLDVQIDRNRHKRSTEIPRARQIVAEFTNKFESWLYSLNLVPVISQLTQKGIHLAHNEAARYATDFSKSNPDEIGDKLEIFAQSLVKKILHGPISFLKTTNNEELTTDQLQAVDLINKMFLSQDKPD